ncbi:MAG: hypothetical protein DMF56_15745 [Acidobacteria bacterium]|nr:MAG: hypothetical protein DMF56_15745 [Acidobacteriota bacterium]
MRSELREAYREEFKNIVEAWKTLETKAQGVITVCGIFVAAAFAHLRDASLLATSTRLVVSVVLALLIGSILFALQSLQLRPVTLPPLGTFLRQGVHDVTRQGDASIADLARRFDIEIEAAWEETIQAIVRLNIRKARGVTAAQILAVAAVLAAGASTILSAGVQQ